MIFINRERIVLLEFLNWRLKSSNGRLIQSNKCWLGCYLHKPKVHKRNTKPLAAVGFSRFDIMGNFSQFSELFLSIYSTLVFMKLFFTNLYQQTISSRTIGLGINILSSKHRSGQTRPTVCYLHMNIRQMSIINQLAFLIWNKATIGTLQYSIWKWNFDFSNAILFPIYESYSQIISETRWVFRL